MAVESWIDELCAVWEVSDGERGTVRSYRVYSKAEFPAAITVFPCAITYIESVEATYSAGGPCINYWLGVTEFHLFPNTDKGNYPAIMLYYARIIAAAAARLTLGGLVSHFILRSGGEPGIVGPVVLQYGGEDPHHGLVVNWRVKEIAPVTVSV